MYKTYTYHLIYTISIVEGEVRNGKLRELSQKTTFKFKD